MQPKQAKNLLALVVVLWAAAPHAQTISVTAATPLSFGGMAVVNGGSVTVSPGGSRTASAGIFLLPSAPGTPAQLTVSTTPSSNLSYTVTLPTSTVMTSGYNQMTVMPLSVAPASGTLFITGSGGTQNILVGGTLNLGSSQTPGNYAGSFPLTINYP